MTLWVSGFRTMIRALLRQPGFVAVVVVTFGVALGAAATVVSLVDAVLLRPVPYGEGRVVRIFEGRENNPHVQLTIGDFLDYQREARTFEGIAAWLWRTWTVTGGDEPDLITGAQVSDNFFAVLNLDLARGRGFQTGEGATGDVVVISDGLWRRAFGARPDILGTRVGLNGTPVTIVGVLPRDFLSPMGTPAEMYRPSNFAPFVQDQARYRRMHFLAAFGRVGTGHRLEEASAELMTIARRNEAEWPEENQGHLVTVLPLRDALARNIAEPLRLVAGAVLLLLLLASANLANLLLARSAGRAQELAVRAALGAGRLRLGLQLLGETVLLSLGGGVLGLGIGWAALRTLVQVAGTAIPRSDEVGLTPGVVGAVLLLSVLVGVVSGLLPAWRAMRQNIEGTLRSGTRLTGDSRGDRQRKGLVLSQVALAVMLLTGCGLLLRSYVELQSRDLGFAPERVVTFDVALSRDRYPSDTAMVLAQDRMMEELRALPGVSVVGVVYGIPIAETSTTSLRVEGREEVAMSNASLGYNAASPGYFEAMGIPLRAGRLMDARDGPGTPLVVVVSEGVLRYLPSDPIGARIATGPNRNSPPATVIGVVGDVRRQGPADPMLPEVYYPLSQEITSSPSVVLRVTAPVEGLLGQVKTALQRVDTDLAVRNLTPMTEVVARVTARPRLLAGILGSFAAVALVLAGVGVYAVLAYLVAQRRGEIGVRMALGAGRREVYRYVAGAGAVPVGLGIVVGLGLAVALSGLLRAMLVGVSPMDPATLGVVALVVGGTGALATVLPARRATRVDPLIVMRAE